MENGLGHVGAGWGIWEGCFAVGQVRWDVRLSGLSLARAPGQGQRLGGEDRCREMQQDMVADGVGDKEGEGCKMPLGYLAWSPWMVTLH